MATGSCAQLWLLQNEWTVPIDITTICSKSKQFHWLEHIDYKAGKELRLHHELPEMSCFGMCTLSNGKTLKSFGL